MLAISFVLGQLIHKYHTTALNSNRESRIIVPGLSYEIAKEIHDYLKSNGVTSYLVIGSDLEPDENKSWIPAINLTSKRIGSFVAVVCPGQLTHIQDSIRGSGGTIRSTAFSEEWPWIDNGSEAFRFDGPVLTSLLEMWTNNDSEKQWLRELILQFLLPKTSPSSNRVQLLLVDILGCFSPSKYEELDDIRLKFLFHAGIPKPMNQIPPVEDLIKKTTQLCQKVCDKCREEENIRQQAQDRILDVFNSEEADFIREGLNVLLDGLGRTKTRDLDGLAFFSCWDNKVDYWLKLEDYYLERLFDIEQRQTPDFTFGVSCEDDRCIANCSNSIIIATFHGLDLNIHGEYKVDPLEFNRYDWKIKLTYRGNELYSYDVRSNEGRYSFSLNTEKFKSYRSGLPLKLSFVANGKVRAEGKIKLHLCGENRPAFVILDPAFAIIDAINADNMDAIEKKVETDEANYLYMFSSDETEPKYLDTDDTEYEIIETGKNGIWRSSYRVDPYEDASGQVVRICKFGDLSAAICIEAKDILRGEFTIEDELRVNITNKRENSVKEVLEYFEGTRQEPYHKLGKINEATRNRIMLAADITNNRGWKPILINFKDNNPSCAGEIGDYVNYRGLVETDGFKGLKLPDDAQSLIQEYAKIRSEVINTIKNQLMYDSSMEHPVYASHPIYTYNNASNMESLLIIYLKIYLDILKYIEDMHEKLEWRQLFVISYLDCVVNWDDSKYKNSVFFINPWHPLVISKRYMVQYTLYNRGKAFSGKQGKTFCKLTALLKGISGFRYLSGLNKNDNSLEPLYVFPTNDPGWHIAVKTDIISNLYSPVWEGYNIVEKIKKNYDLEVSMAQKFSGEVPGAAIPSFVRAFPGRRSLSIRVQKGYSTSAIVRYLQNLLHKDENISELGFQLYGGIQVFLDDFLDNEAEVNLEKPPILIYNLNDHEDAIRITPDIYFISPSQEISFRQANENYQMPRGLDNYAVFSQPLYWLTEGQTQLPNSVSLEFDSLQNEGNSLGALFVNASVKVCQILKNRLVTVKTLGLPSKLESLWAVTSGGEIDPAILVKYVKDGSNRSIQDRVLWDYRFDIASSHNTYYVLSTIPKGFEVAVNGFFNQGNVASSFIEDLGALGIAIGGEALKSGRHALGVLGLVGTIRLLNGIGGNGRGIFDNSSEGIGFLIPVDSFISFFSDGATSGEDIKRTDLLAIQLIMSDEQSTLSISACGVESKFVSNTFTQVGALNALNQAQTSLHQFRSLVELSLESWGMTERLGLLAIINFGLRIISPSRVEDNSIWLNKERSILEALITGRYEYKKAKYDAIVVSTEANLLGVAEINKLETGLWVRINKDHWPGISDTTQLDEIRDQLSKIFNMSQKLNVQLNPENGDPRQNSKFSGVTENQTVNENETAQTIRDDITEEIDNPMLLEELPLRKIFIGVDERRNPVYFDPQSPIDPLDNMNIMITGSSGKGKTQFLKHLILKLRKQGKNVLVLDFKKDFLDDAVFCEESDLSRVVVNFDGLPFNPLIPYPMKHPISGELLIQTGQHITGIASVLKRTYGLGAVQQNAVKNAIVQAFLSKGIPATGTSKFDPATQYPSFNDIGEILEISNIGAFNRLDPLFTLDLFRPEYMQDSFDSLINKSMVLDLSQIPSDQLKNALAELIILSAHSYLNSQPHSGTIRQILVLDEANRLLGSADYLTSFVRECRAYGVGVVLSSQYPSDFPAEISGSMATKILHGNDRDADQVRSIIQLIGCTGREAEVAGLERFQAFVDNRHFSQTLLRTMNYPMYLVWSYLHKHGQMGREGLYAIDGFDTNKLPLTNIIKQLERLGLVEEKDGIIKVLQWYE